MFDFNTLPVSVKRLATWFLASLTLFVAAKFINEIISYKYLGQEVPPTRTITVSSRGEAIVKNDIAKVDLTIIRQAPTALAAQQQSVEAVNAAVAFLKKSGVEERDIKTASYNLFPRYDYLRDQGQVLRGYEIQQTLTVKIRDLDKAGEILSGATAAGVNQVGQFTLTVDDEEAALAQARQDAINKARDKARKLTKELGVRLSRLVSFSEYGDSGQPYPLALEGFGKGGDAMPLRTPEIPVGENKVVLNVSLTYEIK